MREGLTIPDPRVTLFSMSANRFNLKPIVAALFAIVMYSLPLVGQQAAPASLALDGLYDRLASASPAEAARDPALRDAQSRLAVVAAVVKDRHPNPAVQDRLIAGAKEKIAAHIEQGGRFSRANLREPVADRDRPPADRGSARDSGTSTRQPDLNKPAPERTRGR